MFSGLKRIQAKRKRRRPGPPPPVPRQRVQPVRPERLSQIEAERPARLDLGLDAPKRLWCHVAERRRDELGARRPIRREAPPLVTFADPGPENVATIYLRRNQARALYQPSGAPLGDVRRAVEILEDVSAISNRVLGPDHPGTQKIQKHLDAARGKLTHAE